jgi:hypothetical protein
LILCLASWVTNFMHKKRFPVMRLLSKRIIRQTFIAQYSAPATDLTSSGYSRWSVSLSSQDRITPNTGPKLYDTHFSSLKHWCWQSFRPGANIRMVLITWPVNDLSLSQSRKSSCLQPPSPENIMDNLWLDEIKSNM